MTGVREGLPEGRYGRSGEARTDRRLKILGAVLGACLLGYVGWGSWAAIADTDVSGELIRFSVVDDTRVQVHLEVRKKRDVTGVCTVRALAEDKAEVGFRDVRVDDRRTRVDIVENLRTTGRATMAELVGCKAAARG
jgi:hypothetical protein